MAAYNSTALMIQSEEKDPTVETEVSFLSMCL